MATNIIPPVPNNQPVTDKNTQMVSQVWSSFFNEIWNRVGGPNASTNLQLQTSINNFTQSAANTIKGNNTLTAQDALDLTPAQVTAMLDIFTSTLKGLVPQSGGGSVNFLRADGTWAVPLAAFKVPTVQRFSSGTGTYTTPINPAPLYIKVSMIGAGGGGAGGSGTTPAAGGSTAFGSWSAGGGGGGANGGVGGSGGTNTTSFGTILFNNTGNSGAAGENLPSTAGGSGGSGLYGSQSGGAAGGGTGGSAPTNSGAGGGGGGSGSTTASGAGGGGGGYLEFIPSTSTTFSYSIGVGSSGSAGGSGGGNGGNAGSGEVLVEEFYQ